MKQEPHLLDYLALTHAPHLHARGKIATEQVIHWLDCQPDETILEFGIGTGDTLVQVASRFRKTNFFGVDHSELMVKKALLRLRFCGLAESVTIKQSRDTQLRYFPDNYFDKIYIESVLGIQTATALNDLLSTFYRLLKPSGLLICNETIWLESTDRATIQEYNCFALQNYGIIQASAEYPYVKDWVALLTSKNIELLTLEQTDNLMDRPSIINITTALSYLFSLSGKVYGLLLLRKKRKLFKALFNTKKPDKQLMAGYLLMAKAIK